MLTIRPKWDYLLENHLISEPELLRAAQDAADGQVDLELVLMRQHKIAKERIGEALSRYYRCRYVAFDPRAQVPRLLLRNLKATYLRTNHWVPLEARAGRVTVLIDDPTHLIKRDDVQSLLNTPHIDYCVGLKDDIRAYIDTFFGAAPSGSERSSSRTLSEARTPSEGSVAPRFEEDERESVEGRDAAVGELITRLIGEACERGATDIHIEPHGDGQEVTVRLRVDGVCSEHPGLPERLRPLLVARIKAMADLDPGEHRLPQEGRLHVALPGGDVELRVATLPTIGGVEDVVLHRIAVGRPLPLTELDLGPHNGPLLRRLLDRRHGLLLVTGPSGAGKTTTLHSLLSHLNHPDRKIWTVEDPVEIVQPGLRQVQVSARIGLVAAAALRACLRADADVIMLRELRDADTAGLAVQAALGGRLVFAGLDAGGAVAAVTRLLEERHGLDPYHLADALVGVLAQRLVRRLCLVCRTQAAATPEEHGTLLSEYGEEALRALGVPPGEALLLYRAVGCPTCHGSGYAGRVGLHEVLVASEDLQALIRQRRPPAELREQARRDGQRPLRWDGLAKVVAGMTDLAEVRAAAI